MIIFWKPKNPEFQFMVMIICHNLNVYSQMLAEPTELSRTIKFSLPQTNHLSWVAKRDGEVNSTTHLNLEEEHKIHIIYVFTCHHLDKFDKLALVIPIAQLCQLFDIMIWWMISFPGIQSYICLWFCCEAWHIQIYAT